MHKTITIVFKFLRWGILFIVLSVFLYILASGILSVISINRNVNPSEEYKIYLLSNGVHMDIVLPLKNELKDWSTNIYIDPNIANSAYWASFGLGDRNFYLNTPEWSDLTFKTAFKALFLNSPSALHVNLYRDMATNKKCRQIFINRQQYLAIIEFIENSFKTDSKGNYLIIQGFQYSNYDSFYEGNYTFNLFFTCNSWTNKCLKKSGLKSCIWTPFDKGLLFQYRNKKYD